LTLTAVVAVDVAVDLDSYGDGDHFELPTLSSPVAVAEIYDRILDADGRSLLR
jgi:hypothetical protein